MPRVSKAQISKDQLDELFIDLSRLLGSFKHEKGLGEFLQELLTKEEKVMLSKRIAMYSMLYSQVPLFTIQQTLGMSAESMRIYNHKKYLKSEKFKLILKSLGDTKKRKKYFQNFEKKFRILDDILAS